MHDDDEPLYSVSRSGTVYTVPKGPHLNLDAYSDADLIMTMIGRGYAVIKLDHLPEKMK